VLKPLKVLGLPAIFLLLASAAICAVIPPAGKLPAGDSKLVAPAPEVTGTGESSASSATSSADSTIPPIPSLEDWENNMKTYAVKLKTQTQYMSETLVWYYDGTKVFYQIAEYTKDKSWLEGAKNVLSWYRDQYVIKNNGKIGGWRLFPHGFLMDYKATGDIKSKEAIIMLAKNGAFASERGTPAKLNNVGLSRETAYNINCYEVARELGEPGFSGRDAFIDVALSHLQQWTGWLKSNPDAKNYPWVASNGTGFQPFMVGLTCEALIRVCENNGVDSGKKQQILSAIKEMATLMFNAAWMKDKATFWYESQKRQPAPDLNLLICPLYGWVWHHTGDIAFLEMGDKLFQSGVFGAYLNGGKQFSQNYRWSFDYVKWRTDPPLSGGGSSSMSAAETSPALVSILGKKPGMTPALISSMSAKGLKDNDIIACYCASKYTEMKLQELIKARTEVTTNYEFLFNVLNHDREKIKAVNSEEELIKKELGPGRP